MMAFLPLVSANSGRSGRQPRNSRAVSTEPVRMTPPTRGIRHQRPADLVVGARQELEDIARDAGIPQAAGQPPADEHRLGRRLEDDGVAGRQRGEHAPGGDGEREVPRRRHDHDAERLHAAVVRARRPSRAACARSSARSRPPRRPRRPPRSPSWRRRAIIAPMRSPRRRPSSAAHASSRASRSAAGCAGPRRLRGPGDGQRAVDVRRARQRVAIGDALRARGIAALRLPRARREARRRSGAGSPPASARASGPTTSTIHARFGASVQSVSGSFSNAGVERPQDRRRARFRRPVLRAAGRVGEPGRDAERGQEAIALGDPRPASRARGRRRGAGSSRAPCSRRAGGPGRRWRCGSPRPGPPARRAGGRRRARCTARAWWLAMPSSISNSTHGSDVVGLAQHEAVGDVEEVVAGDAQVHGLRVLGPAAVLEHALVVGVHLGLASRRAPGASRAPRPRCAPSPGSRP